MGSEIGKFEIKHVRGVLSMYLIIRSHQAASCISSLATPLPFSFPEATDRLLVHDLQSDRSIDFLDYVKAVDHYDLVT